MYVVTTFFYALSQPPLPAIPMTDVSFPTASTCIASGMQENRTPFNEPVRDGHGSPRPKTFGTRAERARQQLSRLDG